MKLIRASFNNFRILKDVSFDFSTDPEKPLTVIRAANETGKTTAENALIWGFFGSKALPGKGIKYQLSPSDSINNHKSKVEISVEIEFEVERVIPLGKGSQTIKKFHYKLIRTCLEYPSLSDSSIKREGENALLKEVSLSGEKNINDANEVTRIIEESIPLALKDVYFTDGDSAMSFIEAKASQSIKRERVKSAVEALLGLDILETTIRDLKNIASSISKKIDDTDYGKKLSVLNDRIDGHSEDIAEWGEKRNILGNEVADGEKLREKYKSKLEESLKIGDKEKLSIELNRCEGGITRNKNSAKTDLVQISKLLNSKNIAASMLVSAIKPAIIILKDLYDKKQFPKNGVPILEEVLNRGVCVCGSDLSPETENGVIARESIKRIIEDSKRTEGLQKTITSLYFKMEEVDFDGRAKKKWMDQYENFSSSYANHISEQLKFEDEYAVKKIELDKIDDSMVSKYRESIRNLEMDLNKKRDQIGILNGRISDKTDELHDAEAQRKIIESKLNKKDSSTEKLHLARQCQEVFNNIFNRLRNEELMKVSIEMNRIFLDMIGSNPEKNDIVLIRSAELTQDFDIKVYGPGQHILDPDQDLNGASRRAITLAFILALTKISKVDAPNVIDTPLGMMSGFVKQSVLKKTIEEGSQIILFLTHDEIKGVEKIIDQYAGVIFTITNPAHYPIMLVNKPPVNDARVLRCECNHYEFCDICERKDFKIEV